MDITNIFESFVDSFLNSLPVLGVYLWAWSRSQRLSGPSAAQGARLRAVLLALVLLRLAVPLAYIMLIEWLQPDPTKGMAMSVYSVTSRALHLLSIFAYAVCWYFILRMVFDSAAQRDPVQ